MITVAPSAAQKVFERALELVEGGGTLSSLMDQSFRDLSGYVQTDLLFEWYVYTYLAQAGGLDSGSSSRSLVDWAHTVRKTSEIQRVLQGAVQLTRWDNA